MKALSHKHYLLLFVGFQYIFLLFYASGMSVSHSEAKVLFETKSLLQIPLNFTFAFFGQNDFALRLPFVTLHMLNLLLIYQLSKLLLKKKKDALLAVLIYSLLPGVISSALVVDKAGVVIFCTLVFLVLYKKYQNWTAYGFFTILAFLDQGFLLLFFATFIYSIRKKENILLLLSIIGFTINYSLFGFNVGGIPTGHFLEIFGIYGAVFSPFIFMYYIYTLYWFFIKYKKDLPLLWFISFSVFILSIVLSLRQNIHMEDFAAYSVIGVPLMVYVFLHSVRVRLPEFRKKIYTTFGFLFATLLLNTTITFFNKPLYYLLEDKSQHFAYQHHFVQELADELKKQGISKVRADNGLQLRLKFYRIEKGGEKRISTTKFSGAREIRINIIGSKDMVYYIG